MTLLNRLLSVIHLSEGERHDPLLEQALERAAERVDPHLRQSRGWPRRYARPIAAALAQARRVADALPGPVQIDAAHFASDPFVHALFATPEDIRRSLCSSQVMHNYVASGEATEAYMLLSMRREEKRALGMQDAGGFLNREVPQRLVWFSDHQLFAPAPTLDEARENLRWLMFDRLLERVALGVDRLRAERDRIAGEKDHAVARLRNADASRRPALQQAVDLWVKQLGEATRSLESDNLAEIFAAVLSHPQDCLYLRQASLEIDRMGVVCGAASCPEATTLPFTELVERYEEPRTVVLVHCTDIHPISAGERLEEAARWLG